jgi:tetratricopeptide (TPR) repeat protein|tara:strand:- start:854 stop:1549 length:696 start_codon:yes stop_codon:yes gene_type:complete
MLDWVFRWTRNLLRAKELDIPLQIAANLSNVADQYLRFGDYERSEDLQHEAIEIYEELGHGPSLTFCYLGLVYLYLELVDRHSTQCSLQKARHWSEHSKFRRGLADCDRLLALACAEQGSASKQEIQSLVERSLQQYQVLKIEEVPILVDIGRTYRLIGKNKQAQDTLTGALELSQREQTVMLEGFVRAELFHTLQRSNHKQARRHQETAKEILCEAGLTHMAERLGLTVP